MLKVFDEVRKNVSFKPKIVQIDNPISKLHYVVTFGILLICTVLVCSQQYIGEHIRCIADKGVEDKVIETFCFFTSTFTIVRRNNYTAHPGLGPRIDGEPIVYHAYYQWVPFILFGQALMFQLPRRLWKRIEDGRVKSMVNGLEYMALASPNSYDVNGKKIPSFEQRDSKLSEVRTAFLERLHYHQTWARGLVFCEALYLANVVLQIIAMQHFLGGHFLQMIDGEMMDIVFPKVTKCTFYKYGPSGSIQHHDALCVMALNVINEKIYHFLWFWFLFLFSVSSLGLLYRLVSFFLYSKSPAFNRFTFHAVCPVTLDQNDLERIADKCGYSGWLLLHYLAYSMDGFLFKELISGIVPKLSQTDSWAEVPLTSKDQEVLKDE